MTKTKTTRPTSLGIYDRQTRDTISGIEVIAVVLSLLWLVGSSLFFMFATGDDAASGLDNLQFLLVFLAIFMPIAMIWIAAITARSARMMREESQRLQTAIDAIRQAYVAQNQSNNTTSEPSVARKLDEIAAATRKTESALAQFSSRREADSAQVSPPPVAQTSPEQDDQGTLALGTRAEDIAPPLERADFIRALNFPETAEDTEGFTALRRALNDRRTSHLIQAAQDVLTLLSQDGIYMDDLRPDMARPEIWRQFAGGARGRSVAALGGVRDRSSLALSAGRMKQDPIFRDSAHHFLRIFDKMFTEFETTASDADISDLSETRTARAFMLLGRIAGTFD